MTTAAVAAAQSAIKGPAVTSPSHHPDEVVKAHNRLSQASNGSSASRRSKTHVGPWRLGRTLGRGSSGRVRLAKHAVTGQLAAVKIVPKSLNEDTSHPPPSTADELRNKDAGGLPYGIEREVIIMKLIEHPNVMALYDVWETKGELYLVLEYVEGGELFDYLIKKGRLDEHEAVNYFRQIVYGVDYCHRFNICHRDLKPENLLLDKVRNIKIADFGMAALETSDRMLETSCGSPHYASPEIVAGKNYHGGPSDIWSCGVILFALLTGHLPFDDDNIRKLLLKVQTGKFIMPHDISSEAQDLIWKMLRVDPAKRITMPEILAHPLLKKYSSRRHQQVVEKNEQAIANVDHPVTSRDQIDREILKNLQTLWHGASRESVIENLLSPEPNAEKTFYCLLMKYRHDHSQDYAANAESALAVDPALKKNPRPSQHQQHRRQGSNTQRTTHARHPGTPVPVLSHPAHAHHRKHSSQASVKGASKKAVVSSHSRSGSRSSIMTASSSHRRNVAFVRKKGSVSQLRSQSTTPLGPIDGAEMAEVEEAEAKAIPRANPPTWAPDNRASVELASLCEQAFATSPSAPIGSRPTTTAGPRVVSDPLSSMSVVRPQSTEKRAFSLGEHKPSEPIDPGSRPYSVYSTTSEISTTSKSSAEPYLLPMIFEEDRFADAVEEEVDLKVYKRVHVEVKEIKAPRRKPVSNPVDNDQVFVTLKQPTTSGAKRKETSRLQIAGLVKTESFKARAHTGFAAYRTPSAEQQAQAQAQAAVVRDESEKPKATPSSGPVAVSRQTSRSRQQSHDVQKPPQQTAMMPSTNTQPSRAAPVSTQQTQQPPAKTIYASVENAPVAQPQSTELLRNRSKRSKQAPIMVLSSNQTAATPKQARSIRIPLAPKSTNERNIMITSADYANKDAAVTDMAKKTRQASDSSTKSTATSLFRKLTLAPRRQAPPPPATSNTSTATPIPSRDRVASNGSEVKQNWFMKMLNPQYSSVKSGRSSAPKATKTLFSTMSVTTVRHIIVEVLEDWQKYGISQIYEDPLASTVSAVISSRNVLSMRSSKFTIQVRAMAGGTRAVFTQEKGSSSSFLRFMGELERALGEMAVLSPPRTDARVPVGLAY